MWPDDQRSIETLQEIFGYLLTADTSQQKAFALIGPTRSGKGTIVRVLRRVAGKLNCASPTLGGLSDTFGVEPLIGKRVAIISDARLSARADQDAIVEHILSITGEDAKTINRKNRSHWHGQLQTRFFVLAIMVPRLNDASGAFASRFILLILQQSFLGREDHRLLDRLTAELPGILTQLPQFGFEDG